MENTIAIPKVATLNGATPKAKPQKEYRPTQGKNRYSNDLAKQMAEHEIALFTQESPDKVLKAALLILRYGTVNLAGKLLAVNLYNDPAFEANLLALAEASGIGVVLPAPDDADIRGSLIDAYNSLPAQARNIGRFIFLSVNSRYLIDLAASPLLKQTGITA